MRHRFAATVSVFFVGVLMAVPALGQPMLVWESTISITSELEGGDDLVVDAQGNAVVMGYLPVERDFYVIKFDTGGSVLWSRIIGGSSLDYANNVTLDAAGDIYLAGRTLSADFPVHLAYQGFLHGPSDAFLMKLSGDDGSTLLSTFFGGSRAESGEDVAIGADGSLYLVGRTDSIDLETVDPIQGSLTLTQCFCDDAFVTRFTAQVDQVLFSTYLGGGLDDEAEEVEVDEAGNIYFAGRTRSDDWPTLNAFQPLMGGGEYDVFAAKITADYTLSYSTYLGGEDWELLQGMDLDAGGHAYLAGSTRSIFYPTTPGAYEETFVGGIRACPVPFGPINNCFDMFVTKLAPAGDALAYSTYIGGHNEDEPRNLVVDDEGRAVVIGYTFSNDFPLNSPFGTVVTARLSADGSDLDDVFSHDTPGSNAGSGVDVNGRDVFTTSSVGLPYDTYIAKLTEALPGDMDGDGDVDRNDFMLFLECVTGPGGGPPASGCEPGDLDGDEDIDFADYGAFSIAFTGS